MIAAALVLVLILLFVIGILGQKPATGAKITGDAVANVGNAPILEFVFFLLILVMIYLIYRTLKSPTSYEVPSPIRSRVVEKPAVIEPKVIPPKLYEPVFRPTAPVKRQVYVDKRYAHNEEADRSAHEELSNIRRLLHGGEHEIAKKRFVRLK